MKPPKVSHFQGRRQQPSPPFRGFSVGSTHREVDLSATVASLRGSAFSAAAGGGSLRCASGGSCGDSTEEGRVVQGGVQPSSGSSYLSPLRCKTFSLNWFYWDFLQVVVRWFMVAEVVFVCCLGGLCKLLRVELFAGI